MTIGVDCVVFELVAAVTAAAAATAAAEATADEDEDELDPGILNI